MREQLTSDAGQHRYNLQGAPGGGSRLLGAHASTDRHTRFSDSHGLAKRSERVLGPRKGCLDCAWADTDCQHQSALHGSTHGQDQQLLGRPITLPIWPFPHQGHSLKAISQ